MIDAANEILNTLTDREKEAVSMRYGLTGNGGTSSNAPNSNSIAYGIKRKTVRTV
jgi:DNA-directed RNA polymerase sigma subunit (sigma70/sigma32)